MKRDFFDTVIVDHSTIEKARQLIEGCESCSYDAEIPFESVLDRVTGRNPETTEYIVELPPRCRQCGRSIREKTLVGLKDD